MEWTVSELATRAGISGRTLRHYHAIGLLLPDRIGANGYRYYGPDAVARLQRILLLREAGMPLDSIAGVLAAPESFLAEAEALEAHLEQLASEQRALERRIHAVRHTAQMRRAGREPRMDLMLDGFNDRYEAEVVARWGREAFEDSNRWWHGKSLPQQRAWQARAEGLLARWRELQEAGHAPDSAAAREHASTHLAWFAEIPGTPSHAGDAERSAEMVRGLSIEYAENPDFHLAFGSEAAARFAAAALTARVDSA